MKHIFDCLITKQIRMGILKEEERELYEYGYIIMCEWGFNIVMAALIAFLTGAVQTTIIFLLSIIPLRSFAGGYHASTPIRCAIISNGTLVAIILFSEILSCQNLPKWGLLICEILLTVCYFRRVPVDTNQKPLKYREKKIYAVIAKILYCAEIVIMVLLLLAGNLKPVITLMLVHFCVVCSLEAAVYCQTHAGKKVEKY